MFPLSKKPPQRKIDKLLDDIKKVDDPLLRVLQEQFKEDAVGKIVINIESQRRLRRQKNIDAILIGTIPALAGVILGFFLNYLFP